jgi:uncharacterized protein
VIAPATVLPDTGLCVALHCRDDAFHGWARDQFAQITSPSMTCKAVVAETCFLLARGGHDPAKALALIARGVVRVGMVLSDEIAPVQALFERFYNVPPSLADACLRMSELYERCRVFTLDADFHIYRRHGRKVIPLLSMRCGECAMFSDPRPPNELTLDFPVSAGFNSTTAQTHCQNAHESEKQENV